MIDFLQESFIGGLNQQVDTTRLNKSEYPLLINGRNRYDIICPIKLPLLIETEKLPGNTVQGIYGAGSTVIIFKDGKAYYKDYNYAPDFQQVPGLQMDANADHIYAELVPISYLNYKRIPLTAGQINTDVKLTTAISSSPSGLVVQDGINQPWFIYGNFQARRLSRYDEWDLENNREYVPIGKQMLFADGKLYIVNGPEIYHSVTGRPLDFMVNITSTGDKQASEIDGGASSVSHSVDYDEITAINKLSTDDGSIFISTVKASWAMVPDYNYLIFGEPTFNNRFLFSTGSNSQFSFVELLGDNALIDSNGLRSFNAVQQLKNEGRNAPFSKNLGPLIGDIIQDYTAAITFDNYAFFAINTIHGRAIVVFDALRNSFVGLDIYPGVDQIKQFAEIKTNFGRRLFFITVDNKIYEAFAGENFANCQLYVGDWTSNDPSIEQKPAWLKLVFIDAKESGIVFASSFVDRQFNKRLQSNLYQNNVNINPPITIPFGDNTQDTVQIVMFDFSKNTLHGWKSGYFIEWNFNACLSHIKASSIEVPQINSVDTQSKMYKRNREFLNNL